MERERSYYEILGVSIDATSEEIKKAYHRLARQYHPDVNLEDTEAAEKNFKEINQIYEVLSDPKLRSQYDRQRKPSNIKVETQSLTAEELYQRGYTKSQRGDYRGAIADYTEAVKLNSNIAEVYCYRGFALYKLRDYRGANADYSQALQLNASLAEAYYYRGLSRMKLGYIQAAIEDYSEALKINPDFGQVYYQRGVAYADIEDREGAIADLEKAAKIFSDRSEQANYQNALETIRSLKQFSWKEIGDRVQTAFRDSWQVGKIFAFDPMGGLLPAFAQLNKQRAIAVSIIYAIIFDLCFAIGLWIIWQRSNEVNRVAFWVLIIIGIIPFINLTLASGFARVIFKNANSPGTFAGDLFVAAASLLPLGFLVLVSGILNSWALSGIFGLFAICYTILTIYSGCHQISNISEAKSALVTPVMLLLTGLPFGLLS